MRIQECLFPLWHSQDGEAEDQRSGGAPPDIQGWGWGHMAPLSLWALPSTRLSEPRRVLPPGDWVPRSLDSCLDPPPMPLYCPSLLTEGASPVPTRPRSEPGSIGNSPCSPGVKQICSFLLLSHRSSSLLEKTQNLSAFEKNNQEPEAVEKGLVCALGGTLYLRLLYYACTHMCECVCC